MTQAISCLLWLMARRLSVPAPWVCRKAAEGSQAPKTTGFLSHVDTWALRCVLVHAPTRQPRHSVSWLEGPWDLLVCQGKANL